MKRVSFSERSSAGADTAAEPKRTTTNVRRRTPTVPITDRAEEIPAAMGTIRKGRLFHGGQSPLSSAWMKRWLAYFWVLLPLGAPALAEQLTTADSVRAARVVAAFGTITSMYRTVAHNRAVGGVPNSYHLLGRAIDVVRRPGITHRAIDAALRAAGFSLIESLDEHDHSHFAFGQVTAASRITGGPQLSAPSPPPPPRLLADEHGTLWSDLGPKAHLIGEAKPHVRAQKTK